MSMSKKTQVCVTYETKDGCCLRVTRNEDYRGQLVVGNIELQIDGRFFELKSSVLRNIRELVNSAVEDLDRWENSK